MLSSRSWLWPGSGGSEGARWSFGTRGSAGTGSWAWSGGMAGTEAWVCRAEDDAEDTSIKKIKLTLIENCNWAKNHIRLLERPNCTLQVTIH